MVHFIDVEGLTLNLSNFTEEAPISFHSIPGTTMGVAIDETSDTAYAYQAQKTQTGSRSATLKGDTLFIKPMNADNKAMKYQSDYANLPPHPGWVNNPSVHYKTETIQGPNRTDMSRSMFYLLLWLLLSVSVKQEHIELGRILKARKGHKRTGQTSYFTGNPQNILGRSQVSYCQVDSEAVVDDCELMHVRGVVTESFLQRSKVSYASLGYSALNSSNVNYGGVMHSALIASEFCGVQFNRLCFLYCKPQFQEVIKLSFRYNCLQPSQPLHVERSQGLLLQHSSGQLARKDCKNRIYQDILQHCLLW